MTKQTNPPPTIVVYGDDEHRKSHVLTEALDNLLPPEVDRSLALSSFDGSQKEDQGGPTLARVLEDLATLPFLSDRRVVLIREADGFISQHRERLETYVQAPSATGVLVMECRSFPKNTKLHKLVVANDGETHECKKLGGGALVRFVVDEAAARNKRIELEAAARLVDLVGQESGTLAAEIEKLALYAAERAEITAQDVGTLVGQSREEKIFAVMDAAALGRLPNALRLWRETLATDPNAIYKAVGGMAFVVRRWLGAHRMRSDGDSDNAVAGKLMMWGRPRDAESLLRRQSPRRLLAALASIAQLDSQAKSGTRSIETGVETLLVRLAGAGR